MHRSLHPDALGHHDRPSTDAGLTALVERLGALRNDVTSLETLLDDMNARVIGGGGNEEGDPSTDKTPSPSGLLYQAHDHVDRLNIALRRAYERLQLLSDNL